MATNLFFVWEPLTFIYSILQSMHDVVYYIYVLCIQIHNEIELYAFLPSQAASLYWMGVAAEQSGDMHAGEYLSR